MSKEELPKRAGGKRRVGGRILGHVTLRVRRRETVSKGDERRRKILTSGPQKSSE